MTESADPLTPPPPSPPPPELTDGAQRHPNSVIPEDVPLRLVLRAVNESLAKWSSECCAPGDILESISVVESGTRYATWTLKNSSMPVRSPWQFGGQALENEMQRWQCWQKFTRSIMHVYSCALLLNVMSHL